MYLIFEAVLDTAGAVKLSLVFLIFVFLSPWPADPSDLVWVA
jgi:hypothetical protein